MSELSLLALRGLRTSFIVCFLIPILLYYYCIGSMIQRVYDTATKTSVWCPVVHNSSLSRVLKSYCHWKIGPGTNFFRENRSYAENIGPVSCQVDSRARLIHLY